MELPSSTNRSKSLLSAMNQQRLQVFVLSATDGRPLRRIPVYGEANLNIRNPFYNTTLALPDGEPTQIQNLQITQNFESINKANKDVMKELALAISKRVDLYGLATSGDLAPWDQFVGLTVKALRDAKLVNSNEPPSGFEATVDSIVDKAATEAGLSHAQPTISIAAVSMGCLSTDHSGFVSFDLTRLQSFSSPRFSRVDNEVHLSFFVSHNSLSDNRIDVLPNAAIGIDSIVARIAVDPTKSPSRLSLSLPSLQNPSLTDWQTSPGSFAAVPGSTAGF